MEAIRTAQLLGISIDNWQIGKKREKPFSGMETRSSKETQQIKYNLKMNGEDQKYNIKHGTKLKKSCWRCDICGHEAKDSRSIQRHVETHSNKHKFGCPRCSYTFKNAISLYNHMSITHHFNHINDSNKEKGRKLDEPEELLTRKIDEWYCKICGYRSDRKRKVLVHIKTHSKAHSHRCHICSFTFKNQNYLQKHMIIFHDGSLNSSAPENEEDEREEHRETDSCSDLRFDMNNKSDGEESEKYNSN